MSEKPDKKDIFMGYFRPISSLKGKTRSERLSEAKRYHHFIRHTIEEWIRETDLTEHVQLLPEGRSFNILFFEADKEGQKMLPNAPNLTDVAPCEDMDINLLSR